MGADLGLAGVAQALEKGDGGRIGRDRMVDHIGRDDAEAIVNLVRAGLGGDRRGGAGIAREWRRPVKLFLGVDDDQQLRRHRPPFRSAATRSSPRTSA